MDKHSKGVAVIAFLTIHSSLTAISRVGSIPVPNGYDLVIAYNGNNISTIHLLDRLNINGSFRFSALCLKDEHSCKARCSQGEVNATAERHKELPCYCDSHCLKAGDCCYDFYSSCNHRQHADQEGQWECVNVNTSVRHGVIMKTKCPEANVDPLCENIDSSDFLRALPVVDEQKSVVYRNVFCARCNFVGSVSYWRMAADCGRIPASALPKDNALLIAFIRENCSINYTPTQQQKPHLKKCLAAGSSCSSKERVDREPILNELCSFYAFPVCGSSYKNPHCGLCNGDDISQYDCGCLKPTTPGSSPSSTTPGHPTIPRKTTGTTPGRSSSPNRSTPGQPTAPGRSTPGQPTTPRTIAPGQPTTPKKTTPGLPTAPETTAAGHQTTPGKTTPWHPTTPETTAAGHQTTPGKTTPGYPTTPETTAAGHQTTPGKATPGYPTTPDTTTPGFQTTHGKTTPGYPTIPETTAPGHQTTPGRTTPERPTTPETTAPGHQTTPGKTTPWHPTTPEPTAPGHQTTLGKTTPWHPTIPKPTAPVPTQLPAQPPPPLNILFDFSSGSSQISIQGKTKDFRDVEKTCEEGSVYDPFVDTCRETFRNVMLNTNSSVNSTNSTMEEMMTNCTLFVRLNATTIVLYPNGSLWVPLYKTEYNKTDYFFNGSYVFVCTNFASNYSTRETMWSYVYVISPLQILTYAGSSVSVLSLLILVVVYGMFKELRTLPGKNLINLSFAMMFYHVFLFVAGSRNIEGLCIVIAILLHYFLLSSFAWMSVMAFDVAKTFVFREETRSAQRKNTLRKALRRYCLFAWGLPAVVTVTCFALDHSSVIKMGYGKGGFCWIKNGTALLIVVGVPVALVILFNFIALTWAVVAIYKVRKVIITNKLADQGNNSSLALLYIKLTCVLGLTWVLGFVSSIVNAAATTYLFVAVNSLQGFFICLTFVSNKRTMALIRGAGKKCKDILRTNETCETKL